MDDEKAVAEEMRRKATERLSAKKEKKGRRGRALQKKVSENPG